MPHRHDLSAPRCAARPTPSRRARRVRAVALCAALAAVGAASPAAADHRSGRATASAAIAAVSESTVRAAQRELGVMADGIIGPVTRAAIRRYQRARKLRVTGRLDVATLRALGLRAREAAAGVGGAAAGERPNGERAPAIPASARATLERIAACESGGDPRAVSANGLYRGKYQFHRDTWRSVGGSGDPAAATEREQDRRAYLLLRREGTSPWPRCGAGA